MIISIQDILKDFNGRGSIRTFEKLVEVFDAMRCNYDFYGLPPLSEELFNINEFPSITKINKQIQIIYLGREYSIYEDVICIRNNEPVNYLSISSRKIRDRYIHLGNANTWLLVFSIHKLAVISISVELSLPNCKTWLLPKTVKFYNDHAQYARSPPCLNNFCTSFLLP